MDRESLLHREFIGFSWIGNPFWIGNSLALVRWGIPFGLVGLLTNEPFTNPK